MAIIVDPNISHSTEIIVHTRKGNLVKNCQCSIVTKWDIKNADDCVNQFHPIFVRCGPTAMYNCHGLTFASRRTWLYSIPDINLILCDDQYKEVQGEDIMPGDVVLYHNQGDIEHSAIVISKPNESTLGLPIVFSKWGVGVEAVHLAYNCPYKGILKYYRIKENEH